jgi:D-alanine-D-alanine ligase
MKAKPKVAVLANLKENAPHWEDMPPDQWDDLDSRHTVDSLVEAIRTGGYEAEFFEGDLTLIDTLGKFQPDICFNICESHFGDAREAQVPALLEMLRLPYTGSKVMTLALALDKPMTKRVFSYHELPTPEFQVFEREDEPLDKRMRFPLFVKPSHEGTGMGVSHKSIVHNEKELREQVAYIIKEYHQTALVETYIEGREVTVGLVGNLMSPAARRLPDDLEASRIREGLTFFPPLEVDLHPFENSDVVYSNRLKVQLAYDLTYLCPAPLSDEQVMQLNWLTAAVFRVTGCRDVARVDFRLDAHDHWKPYILEVNPLPGLSPGISDIVLEAAAVGVDHTELVLKILRAAMKRYDILN